MPARFSNRRFATVAGWGRWESDHVVTNDELATYVDTSDAWIRERSGIRQRHFVREGETTATISTDAGRQALACAGIEPGALDLIIVATSSPDHLTPPVSSQIQDALGAPGVGAFQMTVGCTGFVCALVTAQQFIQTGAADTVLVIGSEVISRWLDWDNRSTAVLFGDGAAAVVLQATDTPCGILGHVLGSDGSGQEHIIVPAGGIAQPPTHEAIDEGLCSIHMNGREVFKFATRIMGTALGEALQAAGCTVDDIDLFIPHQANARIIEYAANEVGLPMDKVVVNVDRHANTSAATVPIAWTEALDEGRIQPGDTLALVAFGAGLTWAAAIYQMGPTIPTRTAQRAAETARA